MNIYELADLLGVDLVCRRYANQDNRFIVRFENCEVKENKASNILHSVYGQSNIGILQAVNGYSTEISDKFLVFNATSKEHRQEFYCPVLERVNK